MKGQEKAVREALLEAVESACKHDWPTAERIWHVFGYLQGIAGMSAAETAALNDRINSEGEAHEHEDR